MKKLFKDLQEIDSLVGELYGKNPELKQSKFGYAYKRYSAKNYEPIVKDFRDELEGIRIDNALEDDKTHEILTDRANSRGYKYSKEGLKAVIDAEKKLIEKFNDKEVEVTPFITTNIPEEISTELKELLTGILF
jgi:hypothetical protein